MRNKSIQRVPVELDIDYENVEDLEGLKENSVFVEFIIEEVYKAIEFAIESGKREVVLFDLKSTDYSFVIKRPQFHKIIENLINHYQESESYEECDKLSKLKEKI